MSGNPYGTTVGSTGQQLSANSQSVVLASDSSGIPVTASQSIAANLNAQVQGAGAAGSVVTGKPVLVAGSDGTNARTLATDTSGNQFVKNTAASAATLTNVASSASSVQLLASNSSRRGATFYNDSTQVLYLKFGTTASATSYTVQLGPAGTLLSYYELPIPCYQGEIDGIWAAANGNVQITELT